MANSVKVLIGILGLIVVVLLGGALAAKSILSGAGKDKIVAALSQRLGVPLKVGAIDASLPRVLTMTPALSLGPVELGNPPGFSSAPLLVARQINTRVALATIFSGSPRIIALEIVDPALAIETNAAGKTNLEVLLEGLGRDNDSPPAAAPAPASPSALAIEEVFISGGSLRLAGQPLGSWSAIQIRVNGLGTGRPLRAVASAALAGPQPATVNFAGQLGPLATAALPIDGRLTVAFAPTGKAKLDLDVALKGDLSAQAQGPVKLAISQYPVGTNTHRLLPLNGQAAGQVTLNRALGAEPDFSIVVPQASLELSGGQFRGRLSATSKRGSVTGSLSGALSGLRIETLLGAFSATDPRVQGQLNMPAFELGFTGRDATQLVASLSGSGSLAVTDGQLPGLDLLGAITGALDRTGALTTNGSTGFALLKTDFAVADQRVTLSNLQMSGAGLDATGGGVVGLDRSLDLQLNTVVGGKLAGLLGARAAGTQPATANVAVSVTGTTDHPAVRPNVKSMAGQAAKNYLGGALGRFLGGRKK